MKSKKYKAIICDLDGTIIPIDTMEKPSKKATEAIAKASRKIHFGIATARPFFITSYLVDHLRLSGPSIIHGGAQIIDLTSGEILKEKRMAVDDVIKADRIAQKLGVPFYIDEEKASYPIPKNWIPHDLLGAFYPSINSVKASMLEKELSKIPGLSVHRMPCRGKRQYWNVDISHANVGKQYAILEVAQILGIKTDEIIAIGDGYNDFPFLMACGLKVAMGNAVQELKDIADYIAPPVEEDGIVDVIERFIL